MPSEGQSAGANTLPPNTEWVDLPPETARRHILYGTSGWLVFFVFLFELFIIINVGNLVIPTQLFPTPNLYLILADTVFMIVILAMILTKFNFVGPGVWTWVAFHFIGLIFAYSEFGADGVVSQDEKIVIAAYTIAFLLRDIPMAWYFTSSRRVNVTMNARARPNDPFLRDMDRPRANGLDQDIGAALEAPAPVLADEKKPKIPYQTKECPACAEIIKSQARACRYCGYHYLNGGPPAEPSVFADPPALDTSLAAKTTESIDVPVVRNSIRLTEYRGFFIAEMSNGKFQIVSENGERLKKSGEYDSSEYAEATLDYFITIAVELMSYPASLPRTD